NFVSFFTFNIAEGDRVTLLSDARSVVISESVARKYFDNEHAVGKVITFNNELDLIVTGTFEDLEEQQSVSSLYGNIIVPIGAARTLYGSLDDWDTNAFTGFVRLQSNADLKQVGSKLESIITKYYDNSTNSPRLIYLFPFKGLINTAPHIDRFANYAPTAGFRIMLALGLLLLLIGIFNYVNLSTARYAERLKELGVRKSVGAARSQLVKQFLVESVLTALIAYPVAVVIYELLNSLSSSMTPFFPSLSIWDDAGLLLASLVITVVSGLVAGIYPAIYLSSFRPTRIFVGGANGGRGKGRFRRVSAIFQCSASVVLVVLALTMQKQSEFLPNADLGYSREGVVAVTLEGETNESYTRMREKLRYTPGVVNVSAARSIPGNWQRKEYVIPEGVDPQNALDVYYYGVHHDFFETMGMQITAGRSFQVGYQDDANVVINQLFADRLDWEFPIGKTIKIGNETCNIVGVANNCLLDNAFWPMAPAVFFFENENLNNMLIKAENEDRAAAIIDHVRTLWGELSPNIPFNYVYLDEYFIHVNGDAFLLPKILWMLCVLAVVYSGLALLALSSYAVGRRKKEISIRKVFGACPPVIFGMLLKDFLKPVMLANIIALPIAYMVSHRFLDFAFSIYQPIGAGILVFAVSLTLLIAFIATASQTLNAARTNPAESLRAE
ncbi:MAG: ABC transporter permease, partial [Candidatus Zixiibacteriota bacterium]